LYLSYFSTKATYNLEAEPEEIKAAELGHGVGKSSYKKRVEPEGLANPRTSATENIYQKPDTYILNNSDTWIINSKYE